MLIHTRDQRYLVGSVNGFPTIHFTRLFKCSHSNSHLVVSVPEEVQGAETPAPDDRFNEPPKAGIDSEIDGHDAEWSGPLVVLGVSNPIVISGLEAAEGVGEILSKMCNITDAAKPRSVGQPDREILE